MAENELKRWCTFNVKYGGYVYLWKCGKKVYVYKQLDSSGRTKFKETVYIGSLPKAVKVKILRKLIWRIYRDDELSRALVEEPSSRKCVTSSWLGYLTKADEIKDIKHLKYVKLKELERAIGAKALKQLIKTGELPVVKCADTYVLVDVEALLRYAESRDMLDKLADELASVKNPMLEKLVDLGLAKKYKKIYVMPKSATSLFRLSEEILHNVFFVDDKIFLSMPQRVEEV